MKILLLLALTISCPTCNRDWAVVEHEYHTEWNYRCVPTGRLDDAQIDFWHGPADKGSHYEVWSRGQGYGEFVTLEQAKQQAIKIVIDRKLSCP